MKTQHTFTTKGLRRMVFNGSLIVLLTAAALLQVGCSDKETPQNKPKLATEVAQQSYEALYEGKCEDYLKARANYDTMPESYRKALLTTYRQHVAEVKRNHNGVTKVEAIRTVNDTVMGVMQVYMNLTYGDKTQEEIMVPLVKVNDEWKLK